MKAMLFVREVGQTVFSKENGTFEDDEAQLRIFAGDDAVTPTTGEAKAYAKGTQMCTEGNIEAFEVWTLSGAYKRETKIEVQADA